MFGILWIFFDMVVKTVFFVSRGHFWRNNILFHKTFKFFSCFQTLRKAFRIIGEIILVGLSKLFSSVQWVFLEELIFENIILELFLYFWSSGANFLDFQRKFCDRFVKTAFYVSSRDFWLDCFLRKFMSFLTVFGPWGKYSGILAQSLQKVCQNCKICVQKISLEIWFLKKTFTIFSSTDQKFCDFWQKCWVIEKLWVRLYFALEKIHVFLRILREKVFGVR